MRPPSWRGRPLRRGPQSAQDPQEIRSRFHQRDIQKTFQNLRFLGPGDGVTAGDDEAGHAIDAEAMRPEVLRMHGIRIGPRFEEVMHRRAIEPDARGQPRQRVRMAKIRPFGEMTMEQRIDHRLAHPLAHGEPHQAMRIEAGGHAADPVEAEGNAFRAAEFRDGRMQAPRAFLAAEFACQEFLAWEAARGDIGVQQEGPPDDVHEDVRARPQGTPQTPCAEVAPRAYQVEDDIDLEPGARGDKKVHAAILDQRPCRWNRHAGAPRWRLRWPAPAGDDVGKPSAGRGRPCQSQAGR